jgi:hypothetical protein
MRFNDAQQNVVFCEESSNTNFRVPVSGRSWAACSQYPSGSSPKQPFDANQSTPYMFE